MNANADAKEETDEDDRTLTISGDEEMAECKASLSSPGLHMDLDLSFAAHKSTGRERGSNYTGVQEESILVIFELPDGSQGESMVSC